jgi:hypothetical protein
MKSLPHYAGCQNFSGQSLIVATDDEEGNAMLAIMAKKKILYQIE